MSHRVLVVMIALACTSSAASARNHRAPVGVLHDRLSSTGPSDDATANAALVAPPLVPLIVAPTFVEFHSARVENDLLLFSPARVATLAVHTRDAELFAAPPKEKPTMRLFTPVNVVDALEVRRERDKMLLFRGGAQPAQGGAVALGVAMFGAATILSAHAPRPLRVLFDGRVHFGPAIFDGGGMGAGVAGQL
jgi:hypothetical protein